MASEEKILKLSKQLLPTGRAFNCPEGSNFEKLFTSISAVQADALDSIDSILDKVLPDNENFTASDCTAWERVLGVYTNSLATVDDRKLALLRKVSFPRNVKGRQHKNYLEYQLQLAGFAVKIYEYSDFKDLIGIIQHSDNLQHSNDTRHGSASDFPTYTEYVMNCINQDEEDELFINTESAKRCFYIAGADFAYLPVLSERLSEFRNIIMHVKPVATVALLRIAPTAVEWILDTGYWNDSGYWFGTSIWNN